MTARPVLITGVAGQDGLYLAAALGQADAPVVGTVRPGSSEASLVATYAPSASVVELDVRDTTGFAALVEAVDPSHVVNLAALSSVGRSWAEPEETYAVNATAVRGMLDAMSMRLDSSTTTFVQASSSEVRSGESPYAASKRAANELVEEARSGGLPATIVTFFNHESPLRPTQFVTRKITRAAAEIALGLADRITLGNLDVARDWGFAGDYASALHAIVTASGRVPDLEIATGASHTLGDLLDAAFDAAGLGAPRAYLHQDPDLMRPSDTPTTVGDPSAASAVLGWHPTIDFEQMVAHMVRTDIRRLESGVEESVDYLHP